MTRRTFASLAAVCAGAPPPSIPAQFAAALEPAIGAVYLAGGLVSYRSTMEAEE
jgi:hypothetical protein